MSMDNNRRVVRVEFEFEITGRKASETRIKAAYDKAFSAAIDAVSGVLLDGSVVTVRSRMDYDYRQLEQTHKKVVIVGRPGDDAEAG